MFAILLPLLTENIYHDRFVCTLSLKRGKSLGEVRLLQVLGLLRSQLDLNSANSLINTLLAVQAQNRVLVGVLQRPSDSHLGHADALFLGEFLDTVDDGLVGLGFAAADEHLERTVSCLTGGRARAPGTSEDTTGHRGPGDDADAGIDAVGDHFALLFTGDEVVVILHGDELVPAVALGDVLEGLEFPGGHCAGTDVADLAAVDDVIEGLHDFLAGGVAVQTVDLENVDVGAQALNAGVDGVENVLAGETDAVHELAIVDSRGGDRGHLAFVVDTEEALGQEDNAVAGDVVFLEGLAEDFFGLAVRVDVGLIVSSDIVGGIWQEHTVSQVLIPRL
jgi:hypothetical protein